MLLNTNLQIMDETLLKEFANMSRELDVDSFAYIYKELYHDEEALETALNRAVKIRQN